MSSEQIGGIVRAVASVLLGFLAGKGIIGGEQVSVITAAIGTIAVSLWSAHTNKPA